MSVQGEDVVRHVMTSPVVTIDSKSTVGSAAKKMVQRDIGSIVVVDGKKPAGIITERDITKHAVKRSSALKDPVKKIMAKALVTAHPTMSVQQAFELMLKNKIRRLPIIEDEKMVGIVTERDLMRWVLRVSYEPNIPKNIQLILDSQ